MTGKTPMWRRYLTLVRRDIRRDVREEVQFHIDERARELMDDGWPEAAARAEACRVFGDSDLVVEECRRIGARLEKRKKLFGYLADFSADIRFSLRQFKRQPKFWSVIVITLVVGISACTAVFTIVDGVLLKPLPYRNPDRLVHVMSGAWKGIYYHLSQRSETLDLGAYNAGPEITLSTSDGPVRVAAATVSPEVFQILGVPPAFGRTFWEDESRPGGPSVTGSDSWRTYGVVVLSNRFWQAYLDGDPEVLGRSITIAGMPHTIIGIMPPGFTFPSRETALWLPMSIEPSNNFNMWGANAWSIVGHLRPEASLTAARREIHALIPAIGQLFPPYLSLPENYIAAIPVSPLSEQIVGGVRPELMILLAAIGTVFLILCVNVANLLLARGVGRYRELRTRATLGARRGRLIRQLLVENITASVVAGIAGALLAFALVRILVAFLPADLPRVDEVRVDSRVLLFALGLSITAGLVFGLLPAFRAARSNATTMRVTGSLGASLGESRISGLLVSLEFALALALVVSASLLVQSLWNLSHVDPGFRPDRLVSARIAPPSSPDVLNEDLLARLSSTSGVVSTAIGTSVPFGNDAFTLGFGIEGHDGSDSNPTIADGAVAITPGYLTTVGIPLVEGRAFDDSDRADTMPVALVSQSLARAYWGDTNPIGSRIRLPEQNPVWRTVVGVVGNVKWSDLSGADPRLLFLPLSQHDAFSSLRRVVVRTDADPALIAANLRAVVRSLDADTPVSDIQTSSMRIAGSIAQPRFAAYLLAGFAVLALFLAAIGIFGVLSYAMNRRIPEIGMRVALGATDRDVFALLFRHGLKLTLVGIGIGIPLALATARLLHSLLFGVEPTDIRVLATVVLALFAIGIAVSYAPARKAGKIDPMAALRHES